MRLPNTRQKRSRAFEVQDDSMSWLEKGLQPGDILSCYPIDQPFGKKLEKGAVYVVVTDKETLRNSWGYVPMDTTGLEGVKYSYIPIDVPQFMYQQYKAGRLLKSKYLSVWDLDSLGKNLRNESIKSYLPIALKTVANGGIEYIIDKENNNTFSDDTWYKLKPFESFSIDSMGDRLHTIKYEAVRNDSVRKLTSPIIIGRSPSGHAMYNFPMYNMVDFLGHRIYVGNLFTDRSYYKTKVYIDSLNWNDPLVYLKGNYLPINDKTFKFIDFDENSGELLILDESVNTNTTSTQIGFKAPPFSGADIKTNKETSLNDFRGKYVFLDFWATWCGPCIAKFPKTKELYSKLDRAKIEFIGISGYHDEQKKVRELIDKYDLPYTQIFSSESNNITKIYGINGLPYNLLIDPNGAIIGVNVDLTTIAETIEK